MQVTSSMVEAALGSFFKDKDMRAALEAALNAAPGAPTDAEFAAALEAMVTAALEHEDAAQWRDWDSYEHLGERFAAARARVEALHTDARNAGLRELRAWCEARQEWTTVLDSDHYVYMSILNQITAMLKGGDGA